MCMVQPLLPVQVKGSVPENCCTEERTGKSEKTPNPGNSRASGRQRRTPHRCSRRVSRADAAGSAGRRRRGRLALPLLLQELLHSE